MKKREEARRALIIFIKNPVTGKVKTRLAQSVGDSGAMEIYLKLLEHTRQTTLQVQAHRFLYYSDHIEEDDWQTTRNCQTCGQPIARERLEKSVYQVSEAS